MNIWKRLFSGGKKPSTPATSERKAESVADIFRDLYGPLDEATAEKALDEHNREMGRKRCYVCGWHKPAVEVYLDSDLAGKPTGIHRAGAKHLSQAEKLAAIAYANVHALSIGPKTQFGHRICQDCVLDYWGAIKRSDMTASPPIWNE
jgi:hypothetical protein